MLRAKPWFPYLPKQVLTVREAMPLDEGVECGCLGDGASENSLHHFICIHEKFAVKNATVCIGILFVLTINKNNVKYGKSSLINLSLFLHDLFPSNSMRSFAVPLGSSQCLRKDFFHMRKRAEVYGKLAL